jgi:hypothetical protein
LIAPEPNGENRKLTLSLLISFLGQLHGARRLRLIVGIDQLDLVLDAADADAAALFELLAARARNPS